MFHHEIIELENGNLLTSSNSEIFTSLTDNAYREDTIIELDRDTGDIIDIFDLNDVLQEVKPKVLEKYYITRDWGDREMLEFTTGDWIHINSLYLTES
jgi:arylsulfate sulfotransferase